MTGPMQTTGEPDGPNPEVASDDMAKPECGCMRAFKRLLKRLGGGPKSTSKPRKDSKTSGRSSVQSPPAGSGKPPSAAPELPTSALSIQDETDPSQNEVTKNEGSTATCPQNLVINQLPRGTTTPPVNDPSPIHN